MNKRAIVFGANGLIGNYIQKYLSIKGLDIINLTSNDFNANKITLKELRELLEKYIIPNVIVINAVGIIPHSAQKYNATDEMYYRVNSIFPLLLSRLCKEMNINMIHVTTDCVYDGKNGKYTEKDSPTEENIYGLSKSIGDFASCTVIRTSVIGEEMYNKRSLLEWVRSNANSQINGYDNHIWNGVTCLQLAKIIYKIIKNNLFWKGIRHIFSPKSVSKYELLVLINQIYNLNIEVKKVSADISINKSISSIYYTNDMFNIPDLTEQISELRLFNL